MKLVKVQDSDYKVVVKDGGTIELNTGWQQGNVVISGSLIVHGDYTTVESETMVVKDNIIVINDGEIGAGITGSFDTGTAGIRIDRGSYPDALLIFDETVSHFNPVSNLTDFGTFVFKTSPSTIAGIRTNSINTNGTDLAVINQGTGVVTATGTTDYERQALDYTDWDALTGPIQLSSDPDVLINAQALSDYVAASLSFFDDYSIAEDDTGIECFNAAPGPYNSYRLLADPSYTGPANSKIVFTVDGTEKGQFNANGLNVDNVRLLADTVSNTGSNDLILTAVNSNIRVSGYLKLTDQTVNPSATSGFNKLYSTATSGPGDTGLYFVNTRDSNELVSKKRALLFSMIF